MSSDVYLTEHFKRRYKERVSKSKKKLQESATYAYYFGESYETIKDEVLKIHLKERQKYGGICKVYRGFIYWFENGVAITVYPIQKKYQCA